VRNFYDFTTKELENAIGALGNEKYRARQLYQWVYNKGILDFAEMTNIAKGLRTVFKEMFDTSLPKITEKIQSKDGSVKLGLSCSDGKIMESVLMPDEGRNTLCVSTQIGCRMGCTFCVTGSIGFVRNLSASEIIGQIMAVKQYLGDQRMTSIVFMGMGEPVDNLDNLLRALEIIKDPFGLAFSHRRITVSSVGLLEGLKLLGPKVVGLAISLNAADEAKRTYLMPINRLYPIRDIINFVKGFGGSRRIRVTFEYVLIKGVNDSLEDARALGELLTGIRCKINLIPFNESSYIDFESPDPRVVQRFQQYLLDRRFIAIVRDSRGGDIHAACGQLGARYIKERKHGHTAGI
jgi:23S rRNA (adenine2503-C2)-methyltransferase